MGHARLGESLPDTRPWRRVVGHIAAGGSAGIVAGATTEAATKGLDLAENDPAMGHVLYLLAHTVLASRETDFEGTLEKVGVVVPIDPTLFDLTAGFSSACYSWQSTTRAQRTDLGEMAELAATETLTRLVGDRSGQIIPTGDEVRGALRSLSTANGFGALAHEFFSRFTQRFLHYHLDRELSHHTGGNGRFKDRADRNAFTTDLGIHCREAAVIVRQYAIEWYSKAKHVNGINEAEARKFSRVCLKKLRKELLIRGNANG